jgi:TetR/AcrR family transcriptional regulator, transcriptional repressor for nem operon
VRYPPGHRAEAKRALVNAGAHALKENGFNGIGVDGIATAAGVTSGALYSNFPNKEALLEAIIDAFLGDLFASADAATSLGRRAHLKAALEEYISESHCADPAGGCVMPALSADVARSQPSVKDAYDRRITELVQVISDMLDGESTDREQRAWSIVALAVGAVTIARAMNSGGTSQSAALNSALTSAVSLIDAGNPSIRQTAKRPR